MSFRVVRQSKYRHVFGKPQKKDEGYDGIKISRNAWDSTMSSVNTKFLAVVLEAQGGGAFMVIPLESTGRVDLNFPKVCGHTSTVLDVEFCPYNDNLIASGSEDCLVKVWEIPDGGLSENLSESLVDLEGHQRRVGIIKWHPLAENVLLSAAFDYQIFIWDIGTQSALKQLDCHSDTIYCCAWNFNGTLLATTSKDKKVRVIDPISGEVKGEAKGHEGSKSSQVVFTSEANHMFTTGFSRMSERQYAIWDGNDMSKCKKLEMIDTGSGVLFPHYDPDINVMFVAGKGDGNIRYFECEPQAPWCHFLSEFSSNAPQRGVAWLPKMGCNINICEIAKAYKLHPKGYVEVISFTVPRKSTMFQEDIFPPTREPVFVCSAEEWAGGAVCKPKMYNLKDGFKSQSRVGGGSSGPSKPAAKPFKPSGATRATSGSGAGGAPTDVGKLTSDWHAHTAEIKELKTKLATVEIKLTQYKKALADK